MRRILPITADPPRAKNQARDEFSDEEYVRNHPLYSRLEADLESYGRYTDELQDSLAEVKARLAALEVLNLFQEQALAEFRCPVRRMAAILENPAADGVLDALEAGGLKVGACSGEAETVIHELFKLGALDLDGQLRLSAIGKDLLKDWR